jgi:hypothetical protein
MSRMEMDENQASAEAIDHLVNTDVSGRGIIGLLYRDAREKTGGPLAWAAAEKLAAAAVSPGSSVLIATGASYQRLGVNPNIGEMDGPPGAVALARALGRGLCVVPVLVTEEGQELPITQVARAVGLTPTSFEGSQDQASNSAYNTSVVVEGFPSTDHEAAAKASDLLRRYHPAAIVTIEKAGMNRAGVYHNSLGRDTSAGKARIDYLVNAAREQGILTIGIGDGGNEIGMGVIEEEARTQIPYGDKCQCPCGQGVVSATKTDLLVTATVSNWGAYAIVTCLAMALDKNEILHTRDLCERAIMGAAAAGYLDMTGYSDALVDGMKVGSHLAVVELLQTIVDAPFRRMKKVGFGGGKGAS